MAVRTFVFDLDGVVYRGEQPLPGAVDTIKILRQLGHQVYFLTNNSTQTRTTYALKLRGMGIEADEGCIMTSSYATALYLNEIGARGASVYVVGEGGLDEEISAIGMKLVRNGASDRAEYVIVGLDRDFCYDTLVTAQQSILHGARFIATNRDGTYPLENDVVIPGGGTMVAAIEAATGVKPLLIGKPEIYAVRKVLDLAHASPEESVVVGDRLDTDILAGKRIGATTVLVLTGVTTRADLESAPEEMQPDIVVDILPQMLDKVLTEGTV